MVEKNAWSTGARETLTAMLVTFITLKFCGLIDWSWWWVLSPFWVPAAIAGVFFIIVIAVGQSYGVVLSKNDNE